MSTTAILPLHVLSIILNKITDPLQLLRCRLVSKIWQQEIAEIDSNADWRSLCLNKIDRISLNTILISALPYVLYGNYSDIKFQSDWKDIFLSYLNWQLLHRHAIGITSRIINQSDDNECITCMDTWGNYIAIGTSKPSVQIYKSDKSKKLYSIDDIISHTNTVVKFWPSGSGELILAFRGRRRTIHFFVIGEVIIKSHIHSVATLLYPCTKGGLYVCPPGFDTIQKFTYVPKTKNVIKSANLRLSGIIERDDEEVVAINAFQSKVFIVVYNTIFQQLKLFTIHDSADGMHGNHVLSVDSIGFWGMLSIDLDFDSVKFYIAVPDIIFVIDQAHLVIATNFDGLKIVIRHDMYECFQSIVSSVLLHGNNLILGMENGNFHLYYINESKKLTSQNLFKEVTGRSITVCTNKPIRFLNAGQFICQPLIVAAAEKRIYKIKFA